MRWPWRRNREVDAAKQERDRAEKRDQELQPLARTLNKWDRRNGFGGKFRAALGGDRQ
jgi:hypothetical protein